jgi:tRNA threonylcarbamoyladenosine biosynthesis protein TsaB
MISPTATLLSFDTSTEQASLALSSSAGEWTHELDGGAKASATLIPQLLALLGRAGVTLADVDAIGFGSGPGAFTGLRTACSVAQGLAFGADKPVMALDSLLLVAEDARRQLPPAHTSDLWVAMDARMDEVYAASYCWSNGAWSRQQAPALYAIDALNAVWHDTPPSVIAGSALPVMGDRLHTGAAMCIEQPASRAAALAGLARQAWAAGATLDAALALPVYLRDKVAQTTVEREAARAAKDAAARSAA